MKHKSYLFFIAALLIAVVALFVYMACTAQQTDGEYISFTASRLIGSDELEATIYEYDIKSKKISEVYRFPVSAMYSLGIFDKKSNCVYYSSERDNQTYERKYLGDQIYMHNLTTGDDAMLTDDLLAVNYIIPVNEIVFFLAATLENPNSLVVGRIDLATGDIRYWDEPATASSRVLSIDREKERLYVSLYDVEEENAFFSGESKTIPTHTIYSYDYNLSDKREILCKENMNIRAVYANNNILMYTIQDSLAPPGATYTLTQVVDLDSMNMLFETDECFTQEGCLSSDVSGAYSFASSGSFSGISYFDFSTQQYVPVVQDQVNVTGNIANLQMMFANE